VVEKNYAFIVVVSEVDEPYKRVSVKLFNTAEEGVLLAEDSAPNYQVMAYRGRSGEPLTK